jgi:glucokinase
MTVSPASAVFQTPTAPRHDSPRLLADIGGTNARFALEVGPGSVEAIAVLACADHATLADAVRAYLAGAAAGAGATIRHAAIAIANPVVGDMVRMTNHHWEFSIAALRAELGFETFVVVNDFSALAMSLPHLADGDKVRVGGGAACAGKPIGLVGAGTGLGVSGLIPGEDGGWTASCNLPGANSSTCRPSACCPAPASN